MRLTSKTEVKLFARIIRDSDYVLCEYAKIMEGRNEAYAAVKTITLGGLVWGGGVGTQSLCTGQ